MRVHLRFATGFEPYPITRSWQIQLRTSLVPCKEMLHSYLLLFSLFNFRPIEFGRKFESDYIMHIRYSGTLPLFGRRGNPHGHPLHPSRGRKCVVSDFDWLILKINATAQHLYVFAGTWQCGSYSSHESYPSPVSLKSSARLTHENTEHIYKMVDMSWWEKTPN